MSQLPEDWKSQSTNHVRKHIYGVSTACLPSFSIHSKCNTFVRGVYGTRLPGLTLTVKKHPNLFTEQFFFLIETRFWKVNEMFWVNGSLLQKWHRVLMQEETAVTSERLFQTVCSGVQPAGELVAILWDILGNSCRVLQLFSHTNSSLFPSFTQRAGFCLYGKSVRQPAASGDVV